MCGKYFADSNGNTELTLAQVTLLNLRDARIRKILIITGIVVGVLLIAGGAFLFFAFRFGLFKKKDKEENVAPETPELENLAENSQADANPVDGSENI